MFRPVLNLECQKYAKASITICMKYKEFRVVAAKCLV